MGNSFSGRFVLAGSSYTYSNILNLTSETILDKSELQLVDYMYDYNHNRALYDMYRYTHNDYNYY
jgi:hypothetical protein